MSQMQEIDWTATAAGHFSQLQGSPTSDAYADNYGTSVAAAATANTGGVAPGQRQTVRFNLTGVDTDQGDIDMEAPPDSSVIASDSGHQRLGHDAPQTDLDMDEMQPLGPAPSAEAWAGHNAPLLTDYATRELEPWLLPKVDVHLNEPTQFVLGTLKMLLNRDSEDDIKTMHSSRILPPQLLEDYIDLPAWSREYLRGRFGQVELDDKIPALFTNVTNNFYEAQICLFDMLSKRALENMERRRGIQLDVTDFAFGIDMEMTQELPFIANANLRVRETAKSVRPEPQPEAMVVEPTISSRPKVKPEPYTTRAGRETKPPSRGVHTLQEQKAIDDGLVEDELDSSSSAMQSPRKKAKTVATTSRATGSSSTPRGRPRGSGRATNVTGRDRASGRARTRARARGGAANSMPANAISGPSASTGVVDPSSVVTSLEIKAEAASGTSIPGGPLEANEHAGTTQDDQATFIPGGPLDANENAGTTQDDQAMLVLDSVTVADPSIAIQPQPVAGPSTSSASDVPTPTFAPDFTPATSQPTEHGGSDKKKREWDAWMAPVSSSYWDDPMAEAMEEDPFGGFDAVRDSRDWEI